jgi:3-phosphoshikimate 1-carboxyvinyltransferase
VRTTAARRRAITALGARIERDPVTRELVITGTWLDGMRAPSPDRLRQLGYDDPLLSGLLAGQKFATTLFGDESLNKRPMRRVIEPLAAMGARIVGAGGAGATSRHRSSSVRLRPAHGHRLHAADGVGAGEDRDPARGLLRRRRHDRHGPVRRDHSERMPAYLGAPPPSTAAVRRSTPAAGIAGRGTAFEVPRIPRHRRSSWPRR